MGIVRPSDLGVRGALVATIMPHDLLIGAISMSRTTMDTARIAGALSGAGLFAALGMGPAYVAIVCLYIIATALTLCIVVPVKPHPAGEPRVRRCSARRCAISRRAWPMSGPRRGCARRSGSRSSPI